MTDCAENKDIVRRFNEQFIQGGDVNTFWSTIDRDFVNRSAQPGMSTGPDGALFWFNNVLRPAFPDLTVTINDQVAEGDLVVTRKSYQGTHQATFMGVEATGRAVSFEVIDILRLRGGKYVEHWANADMFGLMNQLTR